MGRLKRIIATLEHVSFIHWLYTIGSSAVAASAVTALVQFFTEWSTWLYVALFSGALLLAMGVALDFVFRVDRKRIEAMEDDETPRIGSADSTLIPVVGKTFRNEIVTLDGYSYANCTFEHVTFAIGGEPFSMVGNEVHNAHGRWNIRLTHDRLTTFAIFLQSFGLLTEGSVVEDRDGGRAFLPPLKVEPPTPDDSGGD